MKKKWKKLYKKWRFMPLALVGIGILSFLYFYNLNSLTYGFSATEYSYSSVANNLSLTLSNSTFLPHKIATDILHAISVDNPARYISAAITIFYICFFYALCLRWQTKKIALLSTLLLATSSWLLVAGRQGLPTILYLSWLPLISLLYWTVSKRKETSASLLWALAGSLAFYIPGMVWFIIVLGYTQKQRLYSLMKKLPKWQVAVSWSLFITLLIPFFAMAITNPLQAVAALGLPTSLDQIINFPRTLLYSLFGIFFYGQADPLFRLGNLPYLDIVSSVLFAIGIYKLRYSTSKKMFKISLILLLGWIVGIGLNTVNIAIIMPVIYIFIGSGAAFLIVQWQSVFPENPFARGVGLGLVVALSLLVVQHHIFRYFVAWPNNPAVRQEFTSQSVRIE